ncbi:MAG TPA: pitrilysin family protein [Ignavibacteriaceae bacterium]|nr:pitrilysin family protein [Ignavibacteriaceae bacterium]
MSNYNKTILPSGLKIVSEFIPHVQSFSIGFWFNVGSRDESEKNNGITHFIEHMLFKGTKKRSAKKIAEEIEGYGGYLNAFTSKEHTCYYGRGLARHLRRTFNVISDMIQNSSFRQAEIRKEAGVIIDELLDINDNPEELIFDKFEETIYDGNPLGLPIIGVEQNIRNFTQKDFFTFIDEKYGFNNLTIAASGSINHDNLIRLTEKYFTKDLGQKTQKRKWVLPTAAPSRFTAKEIQQVHIVVGKASYGHKDKERIPLNILSHILGEGSSSRLFQSIREKNGIAYQLNSFLNSFYDVSSFGIYLSTNEKQAEKALHILFRELRKIREKKVSDRELKKAKEYLKGGMLLNLESTTARMFRIANSELYFNRLISIEEMISKIDAVSSGEILEIANEVLEENSLTKVIISNQSYNHLN